MSNPEVRALEAELLWRSGRRLGLDAGQEHDAHSGRFVSKSGESANSPKEHLQASAEHAQAAKEHQKMWAEGLPAAQLSAHSEAHRHHLGASADHREAARGKVSSAAARGASTAAHVTTRRALGVSNKPKWKSQAEARLAEKADRIAQGGQAGRYSENHKFSKDGLDALDDLLATDPPVSEAQRRAMWAAKEGRSTLGIPKSVGEKFVGEGHDANVSTVSQPGSDADAPATYHAGREAHHADFMRKHQGASVTASMGDDLAKAAQAHSKAANAHQAAMLAHGTARQHAEQTSPGYPGAKAEAMAAGMRADAMTKAMLDQRQGSDGLQGWDAEGPGHDPASGRFTAGNESEHTAAYEHHNEKRKHHEAGLQEARAANNSEGAQEHNSARMAHADAARKHISAARAFGSGSAAAKAHSDSANSATQAARELTTET